MWVAIKIECRGAVPLPFLRACRLPIALVCISDTSGCQASEMILWTGVSNPDNPGREISFFSRSRFLFIEVFIMVKGLLSSGG